MRVLVVASFVLAATLAGCSSDSTPDDTTLTKKPLAANTGGIQGLLIDDIYRPIAKGTILLTPLGLTTTTDSSGQFQFRDLTPGSYGIKVDSGGHEAAPYTVDVQVGQFTELEVEARRLASDTAYAITLQYSVFLPCAVSASLVTQVNGYCFYDGSGDSYRPGLDGLDFREYNNASAGFNVTYLVTEMVVNQPDHYVLVARHDNGESFGGEEYGRALTEGEAYTKIILQRGANFPQTDNSVIWNNTLPIQVIVFYYGPGGSEITGAIAPTYCGSPLPDVPNPLASTGKPLIGCREYYGAGVKMGVKATMMLTLFLGPPKEPIETYGLLDA